jgi:hypothetical protein
LGYTGYNQPYVRDFEIERQMPGGPGSGYPGTEGGLGGGYAGA